MIGRTGQILVVDDDYKSRSEIVGQLVGHGHAMEALAPGPEAVERLTHGGPDVVVVGIEAPTSAALSFVGRAREASGETTSIVAVVRATDPHAIVDAMHKGADHALSWPEHASALPMVVMRALRMPQLVREVERARQGVLDALSLGDLDGIVGAHPVMQRLLSKVTQAAQSRATVLIQGETGTGKELIAAAVHQHSKRSSGPFVRLNCSALADSVLESELFGHEKGAFTGATSTRKGRFEQADGGTLFLDEVSEISPAVQVKLLRFLQEREFERVGGNKTLRVDVRIVAASNTELKQLVDDGRFRQDLYYRLNVVRLDLPPLRARPSDIQLLADHFLRRYAEENDKSVQGFTERARELLLQHPWPGNVRELQNAIEQAVVLCSEDRVDVEDLPLSPTPNDQDPVRLMIPGVTLAELERYAVLKTLAACGNSPTRAASILGISRRTIQYRLSEWGLTRPAKEGGRESDPAEAAAEDGQGE